MEENSRLTKLEAWFELNRENVNAHIYLYTEIPYYFVFKNNKWHARQRGESNVVPRMYSVSLQGDQERFYLRLLLLHIRGATTYDDLKRLV